MLERAELTGAVLEAAVFVHRKLGPGFVEKLYERALAFELQRRGHRVELQRRIDVHYETLKIGTHVLDMVVNGEVVVELKSVSRITTRHIVVLRSYLRAARVRYGLILNFAKLTLDIRRVRST